MSYNGSGTFQINTSGQPVVAGTVISSTAFNALTADLATGLSTAITKDGQTATTVRIPFAQGISSTLTTDSSSVSTGSIITAGGVGIAKALYVGTTANIAGTTNLAGLTASSAVATDASKNLVSVTNTGTGNNVLATSPTLVTPILGTPASGSLVNCTDLNYTDFKNRIINGAMVIDQRNAGAAVSIDNTSSYTVDRWEVQDNTDGVLSAQQSTDVPTGQGFVNSLKITATTADTVIGSTQYSIITQYIEGYNVADLMFGTASAQTVTLSFWIKSAVTGQYSTTLQNSDGSRINPQSITINSANTWEKKTVTFVGDTSGTWLTTNGRGLTVQIYPALGSSFLGSAGWNASGIFGVTGQVNFFGTINNTLYITGVQLEKGSTATSFDYRPYGTELALCQRYYQGGYTRFRATAATGSIEWTYSYATTKRAAPTVTVVSSGSGTVTVANSANTDAVAFNDSSANASGNVVFTVSAEL